MKILIALDTSPHSERALEFAARMRWPAGSRVIVASVLQPVASTLTGAYEPGLIQAVDLESMRHELESLVAGAEHTLREAGISTEGRVLAGEPRETLVQLAESERADLIVLGSHGRSGIAKMMLGSVSSHVVTHAPCSVLVVKQNGPGRGRGK